MQYSPEGGEGVVESSGGLSLTCGQMVMMTIMMILAPFLLCVQRLSSCWEVLARGNGWVRSYQCSYVAHTNLPLSATCVSSALDAPGKVIFKNCENNMCYVSGH